MDYFNGTTNNTISLAVIRLPAKVPITSPLYGGAIILNPGGPGGSGVGLVQGAGGAIQTVVDSPAEFPGAVFYDIISFDPRGVGLSEPGVTCFTGDTTAQSWAMRHMEEGILTSSDAVLGRSWSMYEAVGHSCLLQSGEGDIKRYTSTASAATDMLQLVEAHGLWREQEARRLISKDTGCSKMGTRNDIPDALRHRPGEEKIQYWGFSYGSYLGATFAAMYPTRIGRLILDGVVDAEDYTAALWYNNLVDTEKVVDLLYYHCARVGPKVCPLAEDGSTAEDLKAKALELVASLYHNPLPVYEPDPDVITYSDVRITLAQALYAPIIGFPLITNLMSQLLQGNGTEFAQLLRWSHSFSCPTASDARDSFGIQRFAAVSILCSDGDPQTKTKAEFPEYIDALEKLSPTLGAIWARVEEQCTGWRIRPVHRFTGPWQGKTSHPILWIGNTADPVTPLANALNMSRGFEDSVVLTQDNPGHCSLSAFSTCTVSYVRAYFQTGILPPPGTVCQPDVIPFGPGDVDVSGSKEVGAMVQNYVHIGKTLYDVGGGLGRMGLLPDVNRRR